MEVILVRHGETEWSKSGKHTGLTDIALTDNGINQARCASKRLKPFSFVKIFCSPLRRAQETCRLAGLLDKAELCDDLLEWDYGDFEGLTTAEIRKKHPDWNVFVGPVPKGESLADVSKRADRMIARLRKEEKGPLLVFSSGHFLRILGARWADFPATAGQRLTLSTAAMCVLGYEHEYPVIKTWNDTSHL